MVTPDQQWWKTEPDPAVARAAGEQLRALESARRAALNTLLGPTWETETDVSAWIQSNYGLTGPRLGTLPPEIKQALYDLEARAQEENAGKNPADAARAWPNERAKLRLLLTPLALNEYLLRYSPTATLLRTDTRGVNYSPVQFQNLFAAVDPIALEPDFYYRGDDPDRLARQRALQARYEVALQQALGSETYHALRLNQDPLYLSATAAAQQAGIATENIAKLYEINRATQAELDHVRNDADPIVRRENRRAGRHPHRAAKSHPATDRRQGFRAMAENAERALTWPSSSHLALNISRSFAASFVGGRQAEPVQRKTSGAPFAGSVLANGSTAPALPSTTLSGRYTEWTARNRARVSGPAGAPVTTARRGSVK